MSSASSVVKIVNRTNFVSISYFFFFLLTAPTEIYTLSLHDALPILLVFSRYMPTTGQPQDIPYSAFIEDVKNSRDRKSTRLNSSHMSISYAVFCLKKKKNYFSLSTDTSCCTFYHAPCSSSPVIRSIS